MTTKRHIIKMERFRNVTGCPHRQERLQPFWTADGDRVWWCMTCGALGEENVDDPITEKAFVNPDRLKKKGKLRRYWRYTTWHRKKGIK